MDDKKKEKILAHIDKIIAYAKQPGNEWLLGVLFQRVPSDIKEEVLTGHNTIEDIRAIREYLEIRGDISISYDFVKDEHLRDQLRIDNLRMENAVLNLEEKEIDRFYVFCVNAFYQLENIVNYYFQVSYPNISNLLKVIEDETKNEGNYSFKRSEKEEQNVSSIPMFHKINAICNILFPGDKSIKIFFGKLRQVRNNGEHRSQGINNTLHQFMSKETFSTVRYYLTKIVKAIHINMKTLHGPQNIIEKKVGVIKQQLASACFVAFDNKTIQIPDKLYLRIRGKEINDCIVGVFKGGNLVDIE